MIRSATTVRVCWLGVSDMPFMMAPGEWTARGYGVAYVRGSAVSVGSGDDHAGVVGWPAGGVPSGVSSPGHVRVVHRAGHRDGRSDRAAIGGGDAVGRTDGRGDLLPCGVPVLLERGVGSGPDGAGRGPADRQPATATGRAGHGGGRRYLVQTVGAQGVSRVLDP